MHSHMMAHKLNIPTVTPEDLYVFHERHFGTGKPFDAPMPSLDAACALAGPQKTIEDEDENEDDGLGYYPDGVKRTLTNEQIAMFRASEIYALVRERQVRTENEEAEDKGCEVAYTDLLAEDEAGNIDEVSKPTVPPSPFVKRKRSSESSSEHRASAIKSTRRMVRELDSAVKDTGVLDYGDEPSADISRADVSSSTRSQSEANNMGSNGGVPTDNSTKVQGVKRKKPGRKIWWPKMGHGLYTAWP